MPDAFTVRPDSEEVSKVSIAGVMRDGHYVAPPADHDGKIWIRTSALVQASADELYRLWRDYERAPAWQEQITRVTVTSPRLSHWVMQSGETTIEWDAEVLADEPGRRIAWRSVGGESENAGEVIFEETPTGQGTVVTVLQEFRLSKLAVAWETATGRNPKQSIIENLRHFKALAETGEIPRTEPQPSGRRGIIGESKRSLYGETVAVPPGGE